MLLAFLYWLADGQDEFVVPVSSVDNLVLRLPPISWKAPVGVLIGDETEDADDDDPSDDEEEVETFESEESEGDTIETDDAEP
jgi:hypothetical protein